MNHLYKDSYHRPKSWSFWFYLRARKPKMMRHFARMGIPQNLLAEPV